jgi:aryl-alcohol dehydrogenase-like predicted oxidoreductase
VRQNAFGTTGLSVSAVGIGCSRLGGVFSTDTSRGDEIAMVRGAIDAGITLFDTSDMYSHGQSEVVVGKGVKGRRSDVVLATKGGYVWPAESRLLARAKPLLRPVVRRLGVRRPRGHPAGPPGVVPQDFSPAYLAAAVEASLRRLGTDYIDVYQLHSPPPRVVDEGAFVEVLDRLKAEGKIRHYGLAGDAAADLVHFDRHPGITALQVPVSAIDQDALASLLPKARAAGAGVISRSCFAAGLLVGDRPEAELREATPDWQAIVAFRVTAARLARPRKELALQFNMGVESIAATVVGVRSPAQLEELLRLAATPPLTSDERAELFALRRG